MLESINQPIRTEVTLREAEVGKIIFEPPYMFEIVRAIDAFKSIMPGTEEYPVMKGYWIHPKELKPKYKPGQHTIDYFNTKFMAEITKDLANKFIKGNPEGRKNILNLINEAHQTKQQKQN